MQVLAAFREMIANKNLSRTDLHDLIKDGIMAALARRYGPTVEAEIEIDEQAGDIRITVLKQVVAEVEDSARQVSLEEAQWDDPDFEVGDVLEIPVDFAQFLEAVKQLGMFWAVVNEPPPGTLRRGQGA